MKLLLYFFSIILSLQASANVNEKVLFESALENRIEKGLRAFDKNILVNVSVGYKKYESMPGTSFDAIDNISPDKIDEADIVKVFINISTQHETVPDSVKNQVYKLTPVPRHRISLAITYNPDLKSIKPSVPIKAEEISKISQQFSQEFIQFFTIGFSIFMLLCFAYGYLISTRNLNSFRAKLSELVDAIQSSSWSQASQSRIDTNSSITPPPLSGDKSPLHDYSIDSLVALMTDSYWCHEDQYAHWLWQNMTMDHKKQVLQKSSFITNYVTYFLSLPAQQNDFHQHPYYLQPLPLSDISQEDLKKEIDKKPDLWISLSPMRRAQLDLPVQKKLHVINNSTKSKTEFQWNKSSSLRVLSSSHIFGNISLEDEALLFTQPDLIPIPWRKNIQTLVWLSLRESSHIEKTLAQYDARSLASAWIGPEEVLTHLEKHLPEKKLKLLRDYRLKIKAQKDSPLFNDLVNAGFVNEAA